MKRRQKGQKRSKVSVSEKEMTSFMVRGAGEIKKGKGSKTKGSGLARPC